jgi:hypothetical protein
MPRPKVLPSQRRRAAEACNFCRESKKKCSGTAPCSHCLRRGISSQCVITLQPRGGTNKHATQLRGTGIGGQGESLNQGTGSNRPAPMSLTRVNGNGRIQEQGESSFRPISPSESRPSFATSESPERQRQHHASDSSSVSGNPHSRMLLNLRGERGMLSCFATRDQQC